jgi:hypothetical protein
MSVVDEINEEFERTQNLVFVRSKAPNLVAGVVPHAEMCHDALAVDPVSGLETYLD